MLLYNYLDVCLFALTIVSEIHPCCNSCDSSIFICIIFHQEHKPQVLHHSPLNAYLGCFQIFAIMNNAAMNILVHVSAFVFSKISKKVSKMVLLVCRPFKLELFLLVLFSGWVYIRMKWTVLKYLVKLNYKATLAWCFFVGIILTFWLNFFSNYRLCRLSTSSWVSLSISLDFLQFISFSFLPFIFLCDVFFLFVFSARG